MSENPVWIVVVSAVLMSGVLVFGLYPETRAERMAALAPDHHAVRLAIDDYEGRVGPDIDGGSRVIVALQDHLLDLGSAAYRRLVGAPPRLL